MKRIITSTLLLSALALFSACQKSEQQAPAKGESIVFTASFAPETKTVIDEKGKKSLWNQDEIRIFNGKQKESGEYESQKYVTQAANTATAEFEIEDKTATFTGDKFIAVYPFNNSGYAWWNGSADKVINHLWLKPEQTATVDTYDPEGHVAVAYTENHELSFKNACTLLKFTIQSDNIQEIWFESNDGTPISGNFGFNTKTDDIYTGNKEYTNFSHVAVKDGFTKGKTYYMSCIPAVLNSGFTIKVVANIDGKNVNGENIVYTKSITLDRNKIYDLGNITYTERPAEMRTLYLEPGVWEKDDPVYQAYLFNGSDDYQWYDFKRVKEGLYKVSFPDQWKTIIACRMNPKGPASDWAGKWGQTNDIPLASFGDNNCISITGWGGEKSPHNLKKVTVE